MNTVHLWNESITLENEANWTKSAIKNAFIIEEGKVMNKMFDYI